MIGKSTEKAIKAWLALPKNNRCIIAEGNTVFLYEILQALPHEVNRDSLLARFSIASIVAKRYPKRKKVKK